MNDIVEITSFVATAVWRTWPLFALSIFLSVFIRRLKLDGLIRRAFTANIGKAILLATLVGAFSPFCSCTVVPIIAGLLLSGVPLAPVMSFWIASPTMDPEVFTLSVGILGWPMALARLAATLVVSLSAGYITHFLVSAARLPSILRVKREAPPVYALQPAAALPSPLTAAAVPLPVAASALDVSSPGSCGGGQCAIKNDEVTCDSAPDAAVTAAGSWRAQIKNSYKQIDWRLLSADFLEQGWTLGRWILLAFLLEALITLYVPQDAIAAALGNDNPFSIPMAALIGIPLYLNNFSALPIVAGLLEQGMVPGAAIAFLIAGPVTTIPAMTAVYGTVRRPVFFLYISIALLGAIFTGFAANLILQ